MLQRQGNPLYDNDLRQFLPHPVTVQRSTPTDTVSDVGKMFTICRNMHLMYTKSILCLFVQSAFYEYRTSETFNYTVVLCHSCLLSPWSLVAVFLVIVVPCCSGSLLQRSLVTSVPCCSSPLSQRSLVAEVLFLQRSFVAEVHCHRGSLSQQSLVDKVSCSRSPLSQHPLSQWSLVKVVPYNNGQLSQWSLVPMFPHHNSPLGLVILVPVTVVLCHSGPSSQWSFVILASCHRSPLSLIESIIPLSSGYNSFFYS